MRCRFFSVIARPACPSCGHRTRGTMLLIWGFEQCRPPAAQWHDGQMMHDAHARFARRASKPLPAVLTSWQNNTDAARHAIRADRAWPIASRRTPSRP
jgi:hypothetical protein